MHPPTAWLATLTTRWHAGTSAPWLSRSGDTIGAHSARMAILAHLAWNNPSHTLLWTCLTHDLGEYATGDLPLTAKTSPTLKAELDKLETQARHSMGITDHELTPQDQDRLQYLDRLDAYLWASHHAPQLTNHPEWQQTRQWLIAKSKQLNAKIHIE